MRQRRVEPTTVECVVAPLPRRAWIILTVLLTVIAALAAPLLADGVWFDPRALAPLEVYANDKRDSTVFALARARSPERPGAGVLLLGSSATRESLWDEARLSKGAVGPVIKMSSSGQTPLESLYLLEQQALRRGQVVVLAIGVSQLESKDRGERLARGVFLQDAQPFLAAHPGLHLHHPGPLAARIESVRGARSLLVRYLHVVLPRFAAAHIYGTAPPAPLQFYYDDLTPAQQANQAMVQDRPSLQRRLDENAKANLPLLEAALDAAARTCARQGATLVLLENPHLDSDLFTTFGSWWEPYRMTVHRVAKRHGLHYVNLADTVPLGEEDFFDAVHMTRKGRDAWSAQLLRELPAWRKGGN